jgi:hypothetical protein
MKVYGQLEQAQLQYYTLATIPLTGKMLQLIGVTDDTVSPLRIWNGINWVAVGAGGAGGTLIGTPTDTQFGAAGGVSGLAVLDTIADGFDKVEVVLEKLAPAKPQNLSAVTLAMATYTAKAALTGTSHTCTSDTTPTATAAQFFDGDRGTLTAEVDAAVTGTRILTSASDVGSYGELNITLDEDPYAGIFGQQNFWKRLTANITAAAPLSLGSHTYQMKHTLTGNTGVASFFVDDPGTVTLSNTSASSTGTSSYISGVPGVAAGQSITVNWRVNGAVATHYNATQIGRAASSYTPTYNVNPGSPPRKRRFCRLRPGDGPEFGTVHGELPGHRLGLQLRRHPGLDDRHPRDRDPTGRRVERGQPEEIRPGPVPDPGLGRRAVRGRF